MMNMRTLAACDALARKQTREIFGTRRNLPADESTIAFDFRLTHAEKMEQLTVLRQAKAEKRAARTAGRIAATAPQSFEDRISHVDAIHARGMSISLRD